MLCSPSIMTRYPVIGLKKATTTLILCEVQVLATRIGKYKFMDDRKTFKDAQENCKTFFGGSLAKIDTKEEYEFIRENYFGKKNLHIPVLFGHTNTNKNNLYNIRDSSGKFHFLNLINTNVIPHCFLTIQVINPIFL